MPKHTKRVSADKPQKPYPDFPLFPHATKRWAKKIKGRLHYFGPWDDPQGALQKYLDQRDELHAGRAPRIKEGATIKQLVNAFLDAKQQRVDTGELTERSFRDYYVTCAKLVEFFGRPRLIDDLRPSDFGRLRADLAKTRGPVSLGNEIARVRIVMKFAHDSGIIPNPVRYGTEFAKPSRKTLRKARAASPRRFFEPADLRRIIAAATPPLKAMVLLGINAGLGQTDVAGLPITGVNLTTGWLDYPRPKTGIERHIPLWSETVLAIREALEVRPAPSNPEFADLLFLTHRGAPWVRTTRNGTEGDRIVSIDAIQPRFQKILDALGGVPRLGFYALRHTHRTVSDAARDQPAANAIMGHVDNSMAGLYREHIEDARLLAVTDHIHNWLWPEAATN